ncbi:MAG: recombinase RecB [Desulfurococcales archaeon ex4484_58]|nr:MAG: recombinase RecB [Desulfurococcales archaeon ex4484_58]
MNISAKRRWRSSEDIALQFLEKQGYRIIGRRVKVKVEGVEVGEVDAIVEDNEGNCYAVEVKAGNIDVQGIRQAYVNAEIINCKPMIIAKGYADESAETLARKLGVKTYLLSDYFIVNAEELETIIEASINKFIEKLLDTIANTKYPSPEELEILEKIATSKTIKELAEKLDENINNTARIIKKLQTKGLINKKSRNYQEIRLQAQLLVLREKVRRILKVLETITYSPQETGE